MQVPELSKRPQTSVINTPMYKLKKVWNVSNQSRNNKTTSRTQTVTSTLQKSVEKLENQIVTGNSVNRQRKVNTSTNNKWGQGIRISPLRSTKEMIRPSNLSKSSITLYSDANRVARCSIDSYDTNRLDDVQVNNSKLIQIIGGVKSLKEVSRPVIKVPAAHMTSNNAPTHEVSLGAIYNKQQHN